MQVWYAIPSANLDRARQCVARWRQLGYRTAVWLDREGDTGADYVHVERRYPGYFVAVNRLAQFLVRERNATIVITGGDDVDPDPNRCAGELGEEFVTRFPDLLGVMQPTGDSLERTASQCGSPWLGRAWVVRAYGGRGPFPRVYKHFYGDVELKQVAERLDVLWQRPELCQYHDQWRRRGGAEARTDYQRRNYDRYFRRDKLLFVLRRAIGFPVRLAPPSAK